MGFLRKVLTTLTPDFQEDNYFLAYIHYIEERQRAEAEGRDPEEVECIPPSGEGDEDEGTTPLDGEEGTPDDEGPGDERSLICNLFYSSPQCTFLACWLYISVCTLPFYQ